MLTDGKHYVKPGHLWQAADDTQLRLHACASGRYMIERRKPGGTWDSAWTQGNPYSTLGDALQGVARYLRAIDHFYALR